MIDHFLGAPVALAIREQAANFYRDQSEGGAFRTGKVGGGQDGARGEDDTRLVDPTYSHSTRSTGARAYTVPAPAPATWVCDVSRWQ